MRTAFLLPNGTFSLPHPPTFGIRHTFLNKVCLFVTYLVFSSLAVYLNETVDKAAGNRIVPRELLEQFGTAVPLSGGAPWQFIV